MAQFKVYVTRSIVPAAIEKLKDNFSVEVWNESTPPPKEHMLKVVQNFDAILIEANDVMDEEILAAASKLKAIATRAVGYDNIDLNAATERKIAVGNTPGILHESCADFTFGLMLDLGRRISYANQKVISGDWKYFDQTPYLGTDIYGKNLGLLGLGLIGSAVAKRANGFGMNISYFSRSRKKDLELKYDLQWQPELDDMLNTSDYVSIHVPLNPDTRHIIGSHELNVMNNHAFLINTSRGGTLDHDALRKALIEKRIAGAALDVTDPEPISESDPLVKMSNVIITPHISSASSATFQNMGIMAANNIIQFLNTGKMIACLNPSILD
jgi:glyoxylate reductase